ncbi:MAG TPA: ABC transporter ATP-binding protein [Chthoniobacter sp.]|nr:ABC transporter ATP-binding protein [Chthoniobacter sp.]
MTYLLDILRFGWKYLRRYWVRFAAGIYFSLVFGLSNGVLIWGTKTILERLSPPPTAQQAAADAAAAPPHHEKKLQRITHQLIDEWLPRAGRPIDTKQIFGGLFFLPLLMGLRGYSRYLSAYLMSWVSEHVVADLRYDVLTKLSSLSLDYFNRSTMGDLLMRINGDTAALNRCLSIGFTDMVKEPFTMLSIALTLCAIDWKLTLATVVLTPLCGIPLVTLGRNARKAGAHAGQATISQSSLLVEVLGGIRVVKALNLESEQAGRFQEMARKFIDATLKSVRTRELINPVIETISMFGLGMLIIYVFFSHRTTPEMVSFLAGMLLFFIPVKKLATMHLMLQESKFGVDRLAQILAEQPTVKEKPEATRLTELRSGIDFRGVTFGYDSRAVLQGIDLHLPRGWKLGLVGENGSGKSTLVNLLLRFYDPTQGKIEIDGQDLRDVEIASLRRLIGLISQEVVIFDQSVGQNIACARPGATQAEIEAAARAANAHDFILELPQGYETRVGERGVLLSGGQRQRIAIARAFIRNAPILILDEATASLDARAEAEVQAVVDRLEENRTVICVAHRLSTLALMDEIIVLSQGQIVERGTFQSLVRSGGHFAAMARQQGIEVDRNLEDASATAVTL